MHKIESTDYLVVVVTCRYAAGSPALYVHDLLNMCVVNLCVHEKLRVTCIESGDQNYNIHIMNGNESPNQCGCYAV